MSEDENIISKNDEIVKDIIEFQQSEIARLIPAITRYKVISRQKWMCNYCKAKLKYSINKKGDFPVAHIDHIHPYSKRNTYINGFEKINEIENLQALCPACNFGKGVTPK